MHNGISINLNTCRGPVQGKIPTSKMALKQWHKTRGSGDKGYNDGLNTHMDMAYSLKRQTNTFVI